MRNYDNWQKYGFYFASTIYVPAAQLDSRALVAHSPSRLSLIYVYRICVANIAAANANVLIPQLGPQIRLGFRSVHGSHVIQHSCVIRGPSW